jgi:blue copper oxidase
MKMPNGMPMAMMDSPLNGVDYTILQIDVVAALTNPIITIPSVLVTNGQNDLPQIADVKKTRVIKFTPVKNPTPLQAMDGPFLFNDSTFDMTRIDQDVTLNDVEIWELRNMTMVAHPFHIHDVQFFILDDDGKLPSPEKSGRKDVVSVGPKDTVRFITVFKDFSGTTPYMFHCHNLMHEDGGMMGQFTVTSDLGINETHAISDVSVFPNPSNGILTIQNYGSAHLNVRITNSMGQELIQVEELSNLNNSIDLSGFANGTYLVSITDGINKQTKKVIIQH